jgi:integrase/recombinase XerD
MDPRIRLKSAFELFILECQSRRFTAHTLRFYRGRLSLFLTWCERREIEWLTDLTHHHIRQYLVEVQESGVSSAYHHSLARAIRAFLNYCVRDDLLPASPFRKVQMPRLEKKVLEAVSREDINAILKACRYERDKAIILLMLDSGIRASELCALNVGDVDFTTGEVIIRHGKGQKGRSVYIGSRTRKQLRRYFIRERGGEPGSQRPLFTTQDDDSRFVYHTLKQLLRRLREKSGVRFSAHSLRRTFAINSLRNGMDIYTLAKLMGHTDITVLRAYLPLVNSDLRIAQEKFGVVENL